MKIKGLFLICGCLVIAACSSSGNNRLKFTEKGRAVPEFNADSAYHYMSRQVEFGPRFPGSEGHEKAKSYLVGKLQEKAGTRGVYVQEFTHVGYEGDTLHLSNIIAAFNPSATDRIMLSAHWDTRPRAEEAATDTGKPILGADDGASGVAVLLEMARLFEENSPPVGVDIILFDGEDYGRVNDNDQYFLGSRYWSNNPPVKNYQPRFGILLDMVGARNALFPKEQNSYRIAPGLVDEIWNLAGGMGYDSLFVNEKGSYVSDDHVIVSQNTGIPTIDIIHHRLPENPDKVNFPPHWHTHRDNTDIISRETLRAVGEVLSELVYNRL